MRSKNLDAYLVVSRFTINGCLVGCVAFEENGCLKASGHVLFTWVSSITGSARRCRVSERIRRTDRLWWSLDTSGPLLGRVG